MVNLKEGNNNNSTQVFAYQTEIWEESITAAKRLAYKYAPGDEEVEDAAVAGLYEAAKRFNPNNGRKNHFRTYAHKWIIRGILRAMKKPKEISMYEPLLNNDSNSTLEIKDTLVSGYNLQKEYEKKELSDKVRKMIGCLKPKQRLVIFGRYFCDKPLRDIAKELNLSFERIRQIENEAISAMRRSPITKEIKIYAN